MPGLFGFMSVNVECSGALYLPKRRLSAGVPFARAAGSPG